MRKDEVSHLLEEFNSGLLAKAAGGKLSDEEYNELRDTDLAAQDDPFHLLFEQTIYLRQKIVCPLCGCEAEIIQADAFRTGMEINCPNCSSYYLRSCDIAGLIKYRKDFYRISGHLANDHREPMTVPCINETSIQPYLAYSVPEEEKLQSLVFKYYAKMSNPASEIEYISFPAQCYAVDAEDLYRLTRICLERGYMKADGDFYTVTAAGKEFIDKPAEAAEASVPDRKRLPTVFFSYCHRDSSVYADSLEKALVGKAVVKRDKNEVDSWESFREFMDSIREQDFAVLFISDGYLKSENCMYEVLQALQERNCYDRLLTVVTDSRIYDKSCNAEYLGYWNDKYRKLEEEEKGLSLSSKVELAGEARRINLIMINIGAFLSRVQDRNNPNLSDAKEAIMKKIRQAG